MTTARNTAADPSMDATLGERVHSLMWRARVSQTAIAPKLGMSQAALSKKLRGERGWSLDEVKAVTQLFNTTAAYLFGETENPHPENPDGGTVRPEVFETPTLSVKYQRFPTHHTAEILPFRKVS